MFSQKACVVLIFLIIRCICRKETGDQIPLHGIRTDDRSDIKVAFSLTEHDIGLFSGIFLCFRVGSPRVLIVNYRFWDIKYSSPGASEIKEPI
jgi:hypothetical protein